MRNVALPAQSPGHFDAVQPRQAQIEHDKIRAPLTRQGQGVHAVASR